MTIGPKTPINIPQADLGPDTTDPRISEWVADAHANAWTWWTTSRNYSDQPTWNKQVAHAIWQANVVIGLHSSDWDPDLTPVWEAIAAWEHDEGEGGTVWSDALAAFTRIARVTEVDDWVTIEVDHVHWSLMVHTGGPFGAMRPATYKWVLGNSIHPYIRIEHEQEQEHPDVFEAAVKLLLKQDVPAYMVPEARALLTREGGIRPECVDQVVSVWEKRRRSRAEGRVGGPLERGLDFWAKKLLGREHPVATSEWEAELAGKTDAEGEAERRSEENSKKEIREAHTARVEGELAKMDREELADRHRSEMDRYEAEAKAKALRDAAEVPLGMEKVLAPNPGRRHPQLLVSPPEMTQEQWEWVMNSNNHVYVAEVTNPQGAVVTRWIGNQDWRHAAEDYLTGRPGPRRGSANFGPRVHTVTVWDTLDRSGPTATIRWTPGMQADMDDERAVEAQQKADSLARAARASRREATNPTPETPVPSEEPLEEWERELLEGKRGEQ